MEEETINIKISDMLKLNISWADYCNKTGANFYAIREGLPLDTYIDVPLSLIKTN